MEKMRVKLTFIDEILGTASSDPEIHRSYIASKGPDATTIEEELETLTVDEVTEKGMTIFSKDSNGNPVLWNYQIRGFFKSACSAMRAIKDSKSSKLKAYKNADADNRANRMIPIKLNGEMGNCQRPLRAQTMQGERVALANSEAIPAGSSIEFDIVMLDPNDKAMIEEWLDYGSLNGIGQWRNSGKGAFTWELVDPSKPKNKIKDMNIWKK